jgi:hypothetical protein
MKPLSYSAALGGLAGPLHGLANQEVLRCGRFFSGLRPEPTKWVVWAETLPPSWSVWSELYNRISSMKPSESLGGLAGPLHGLANQEVLRCGRFFSGLRHF